MCVFYVLKLGIVPLVAGKKLSNKIVVVVYYISSIKISFRIWVYILFVNV